MHSLRTKRVLMVSSLWPPAIRGGAEGYAAELTGRLRERGHEVGAVTLGVDGPDVVATVRAWPYRLDEYANQGIARRIGFHSLDVYRPSTRRAIQAAIRAFSPDIVHSHLVSGLSAVALTEPARRGVAHVHTLHSYWLLCQRTTLCRRDGTNCETRCRGCRVISTLRNAAIARHPPHIVLAVSQYVADMHAGLNWVDGRIRVVRHAVESRPTHHAPPAGAVTFAYVGRLTVEKGVATLLEAFADTELEHARLVLAGDGPLRDLVTSCDDQRVSWRGWVEGEAKDEVFACADCLIVPSQWREPAGLVVNEARARGIPVIAARTGGVPEFVAPGSAGLLFPPGDAPALTQRLERFAAEPETYYVRQLDDTVTWDRHLELVERAYDDAVRVVEGNG